MEGSEIGLAIVIFLIFVWMGHKYGDYIEKKKQLEVTKE